MSDFRIKPRLAGPAPARVAPRLTETQLTAGGLKDLFGKSPVAYRRVDGVTATHVEVEGARLPRAAVGDVAPGQWLKFSKRPDGGVQVAVDPQATRRAEGRLSGLFEALKK
jgi:hypothetical protein